MLDFLQMLVSGIVVGSSYALMGLAMVIIYKTSEVVNFAQGEMALLSVFMTYLVLEFYHVPFYIAFPGALVFAVILGAFLEFAVLRRAKEPNVLGMIIITIGDPVFDVPSQKKHTIPFTQDLKPGVGHFIGASDKARLNELSITDLHPFQFAGFCKGKGIPFNDSLHFL